MKKTTEISLAERLDDERPKTRARVASWGKSHPKSARERRRRYWRKTRDYNFVFEKKIANKMKEVSKCEC
jgi:hypothetical protein